MVSDQYSVFSIQYSEVVGLWSVGGGFWVRLVVVFGFPKRSFYGFRVLLIEHEVYFCHFDWLVVAGVADGGGCDGGGGFSQNG